MWLFRGSSGADRAIRGVTNAPVNHVGMAVVIDDLPPLLWHAELGRSLPDLWAGTHHRGVQLHDLRDAVLVWGHRYGQRGWLRQLTGPVDRAMEDAALRTVARLDGTPFPSTARLAGRWLRGGCRACPDGCRACPGAGTTPHRRRPMSSSRRPTAPRSWRSPSPRWGCCRPTGARTRTTRAGSGAATTSGWPPASTSAARSRSRCPRPTRRPRPWPNERAGGDDSRDCHECAAIDNRTSRQINGRMNGGPLPSTHDTGPRPTAHRPVDAAPIDRCRIICTGRRASIRPESTNPIHAGCPRHTGEPHPDRQCTGRAFIIDARNRVNLVGTVEPSPLVGVTRRVRNILGR